jgi:hypothetical protein
MKNFSRFLSFLYFMFLYEKNSKHKKRLARFVTFFVILARSESAIILPKEGPWKKNKRGIPPFPCRSKREHTVSRRQTTCEREGKTRPFLLCERVPSKTHILYSFRRATSARGACVFILVFSNDDATFSSQAHVPNVKAKKFLRVNC